jgi:hypothetical protein
MECLGWYANRRSRDRIDATTKTSTWIIDKEEEGGGGGWRAGTCRVILGINAKCTFRFELRQYAPGCFVAEEVAEILAWSAPRH